MGRPSQNEPGKRARDHIRIGAGISARIYRRAAEAVMQAIDQGEITDPALLDKIGRAHAKVFVELGALDALQKSIDMAPRIQLPEWAARDPEVIRLLPGARRDAG